MASVEQYPQSAGTNRTEVEMPKGKIRTCDGEVVKYDDVRRSGNLVVFKRAYSGDVHAEL